MLTGILQRFGRRDDAPPKSDRLPAELVAAIEGASVVFRQGDGDDDALPVVRIPGLGSWKFDGLAETAERVAAAYPELSPMACRKAARLVAAQVGKRNWADMRGQPRRASWVFDWGRP
ncbi:MAG: hypothetical protein ACNA7O_14330 [Rhodobacterales bacterium]